MTNDVHSLSDTEKLLLGRMGNFRRYCEKREQIESGVCPFCTIDPEINEVLYENDYWMIWEVPVSHSRRDNVLELYLVIVAKTQEGEPHPTSLGFQPDEFWVQLGHMLTWAYENYDIPGGAIIARLGDPRYSAATEEHLHINLKVPNLMGELREPVAKSPDDVQANMERGERFGRLYEQGITAEQFDQLVTEGKYRKDGTPLEA